MSLVRDASTALANLALFLAAPIAVVASAVVQLWPVWLALAAALAS